MPEEEEWSQETTTNNYGPANWITQKKRINSYNQKPTKTKPRRNSTPLENASRGECCGGSGRELTVGITALGVANASISGTHFVLRNFGGRYLRPQIDKEAMFKPNDTFGV